MGSLKRFTNLLAHVSEDIPVVKAAADREADRRAGIENARRALLRASSNVPPRDGY